MTKAILIRAGGTPTLIHYKSLEDLQGLVGGRVEGITFKHDLFGYVNDDGKGLQLEPNRFATTYLHSYLFPGDWIAGNIVLVGPAGPDGEDQDIPAKYIKTLITDWEPRQ